jgi:hypothetical protein
MTADLTHLTGRVPDGQGHPAEADRQHEASIAGQHHKVAAGLLAQAAAAGDLGAVRRLVHECEHELGPLQVDPWRLLEALAARWPGPASAA